MIHHRTTDPACTRHRAPRTWWQRVLFNRARGISCPACSSTPFVQHGGDFLANVWRHPVTDVVIFDEDLPAELTP